MLAVIPEPLAASRCEAFPFDSSIVDAADGVSVVAVCLLAFGGSVSRRSSKGGRREVLL